MPENTRRYDKSLSQFYKSTDLEETIQALDRLSEFVESAEITVQERYELQVYAFRTLIKLTIDAPQNAKDLILNRLLPYCLYSNPEAGVALIQHRECLVDWLEKYPESVKSELRSDVLDRIRPHLGQPDSIAACRTISHIGYRRDDIVSELWDIVRRDAGEVGDVALSTLVSLGIPSDERISAMEELNKRVSVGFRRSLASALSTMADRSTFKLIFQSWLSNNNNDLSWSDISIVFGIFRVILNATVDDHAFQDESWNLLSNLVDKEAEKYSHAFDLGNIVPACNSIWAVPGMLSWLANQTKKKADPAWGRYLVQLRLEECVRPRQLQSWRDIDNRETIEQLRLDACQDTGLDLLVSSKEDSVKKMAWQTLFRAKHSEALNWFNEAVENETGRFLQQHIIELFSCLRITPLPDLIKRWVTERYDEPKMERDSREFSRRMAAVQMARSAATSEAFEALLNFGFTYQGIIMKRTTDALAEAAIHRVREEDTSIVPALMDVVLNGSEKHQRVAAAFALEKVARSEGSLPSQHVQGIVSLLYDTKREAYEKGSLIGALAVLKDWQMPDELQRDFESWAREPDRWIGGSSLEILARHGELTNNAELLTSALGLKKTSAGWDFEKAGGESEWAPYFIGLLYYQDPIAFLPAVRTLILGSSWHSVAQVVYWLRELQKLPEKRELPEVIRTSLIQRIRERQSASYGETEIFSALSELASEELVAESWDAYWKDWLPDSRVALGNALGEVKLQAPMSQRAILQLKLLARDGQYAVRRAAYRGLARQSMEELFVLCLSWSDERTSVELRQRAAEAHGWLDSANGKIEEGELVLLHQTLISDRDKLVREVARRSWESRRERRWANDYLSMIKEVAGKTSEEILAVWCYGDALIRLGDDTVIQALEEHLRREIRPPHLRFWIQRMIKKMKKNWRKTTQKWPQPWFAWQGLIREGQGKVIGSNGQEFEVEYSIWQQHGSVPSELHEWGGAAKSEEMPMSLDVARIELEDGGRGNVLTTNFSGDTVIFVGTGDFPS